MQKDAEMNATQQASPGVVDNTEGRLSWQSFVRLANRNMRGAEQLGVEIASVEAGLAKGGARSHCIGLVFAGGLHT